MCMNDPTKYNDTSQYSEVDLMNVNRCFVNYRTSSIITLVRHQGVGPELGH